MFNPLWKCEVKLQIVFALENNNNIKKRELIKKIKN